jgi:ankyrin repeat protein
MRLRKSITAVSIILLVGLAVTVTYCGRRHFVENALREAVAKGDVAGVERLVSSFPCPVKTCDRNGFTPLHQAANIGNYEIVRLLLSKGADVNAKDYEHGTEMTPLHYAVEPPHNSAIIELLIAHGGDVNGRDLSGRTPLYSVIAFQNMDAARILIARGADVNFRDRNSMTPLGLCKWKELDEIANAKGNKEREVLLGSIVKKNRDIEELLVNAGAKE